jgi:hypothetical protein
VRSMSAAMGTKRGTAQEQQEPRPVGAYSRLRCPFILLVSYGASAGKVPLSAMGVTAPYSLILYRYSAGPVCFAQQPDPRSNGERGRLA